MPRSTSGTHRRGELRAARIGARGDYRIGRADLEAYIERSYAEAERWIEEHPFDEASGDWHELELARDAEQIALVS